MAGERVAIVTGAAKGLGAGVARRLAHDGASVICLDVLDPRPAVQRLEVVGGAQHTGAQVDISVSEDVEALVARVLDRYGAIDALVNNAAVAQPVQPLVDTSDEVVERVLAVNVRGTIACSRAVGRAMRERGRGRIVNVASQVGRVPWPGQAVYAASKAAVIALTQAMALELVGSGVIVNCICPGTMATDQMRGGFRDRAKMLGRDVEELIEEKARSMPLGRMGTPEDLAAMVAWLLSEEASFTVGAFLNLTGGECIAF